LTNRVEVNDNVGDGVENTGERGFGSSGDPKKAVGLFIFYGFFENGDFAFGLKIFEVCFAKDYSKRSNQDEGKDVDDNGRGKVWVVFPDK